MLCEVFRRVQPAQARVGSLRSLRPLRGRRGPRYIATNPPRGVGTGGTTPPLATSMHCRSSNTCGPVFFCTYVVYSASGFLRSTHNFAKMLETDLNFAN